MLNQARPGLPSRLDPGVFLGTSAAWPGAGGAAGHRRDPPATVERGGEGAKAMTVIEARGPGADRRRLLQTVTSDVSTGGNGTLVQ